jgi:hypothetical protein
MKTIQIIVLTIALLIVFFYYLPKWSDKIKSKTIRAYYKIIAIKYPEESRRGILASLISDYRFTLGIPELVIDEYLDKLAERRAEELDSSNEIAHYGVVDEFVLLKNKGAKNSAELLAGNFGTPEGVLKGWIQSEKHHHYLVSWKYNAMAVHCRYDESQERWIDVLLMINTY